MNPTCPWLSSVHFLSIHLHINGPSIVPRWQPSFWVLVVERPVWYDNEEDDEGSSSPDVKAVIDVACIETGNECDGLQKSVFLLAVCSIEKAPTPTRESKYVKRVSARACPLKSCGRVSARGCLRESNPYDLSFDEISDRVEYGIHDECV